MSSFNYPLVSENSASFQSASFITSEERENIYQTTVQNKRFGSLKNEIIEFSAFDLENNLVGWNRVENEIKTTPITRSYFDLDRNLIQYSFDLVENGYLSLTNGQYQEENPGQIGVSVADDLNDLNLGTGNYKVQYILLKDEVGDVSEKMYIKEISPSRKELKLSLQNNPSTNLLNRFINANSDRVLVSEIISPLTEFINSARLDETYFDIANDSDERLITEIKFFYSLHRDIDMINFIDNMFVSNSDVVVTIKYQFENWLFSNYDVFQSFDDIRTFYREIAENVIVFSLIEKSSLQPAEFNEYVNFFLRVFDAIFLQSINNSETLYRQLNGDSLKEILNFENNNLFPILNKDLRQENNQRILVLKLKDALPDNLTINSRCFISRLVRDPVFQNVNFYQNQIPQFEVIRGPNFFVDGVENNPTKILSTEQLGVGDSTIKAQDIDKNLNVDYRFFENFVKFSSAVTRLENYQYKLSQISDLEEQVDKLDPNDINNLSDISIKRAEIDDIKNSFDGYETFLFNNPEWYFEHTAVMGEAALDGTVETSASLYDRDNESSLINNTQDFIVEDDNYSDFTTFIKMTGQMFDQLWLYIENMPTITAVENRDDIGLPLDMVNTMLKQFGWNPQSGTETEDLALALESGVDSDSLPAKTRTQTIWKRILNNLPYILKTKGTEEAIRSLFACYGIPRSLYTIKEFGGIRKIYNPQDDNLFVFDSDFYALHFEGKNEYLKLPWSPDVRTVEFKFSFDGDKTYDEGEIFRLVNCEDRWVIGAIRERGSDWGRMFFTLAKTPGDSEFITIATERMPVFNGDLFTLMLRRNEVGKFFGLSDADIVQPSVVDQYPLLYELVVKRGLDDRILFEESASFLYSGSYNTTFRSPGTSSYVYVGNHAQSTGSLTPDPESFFGVIDQVKFFKRPLNNSRFDSHVFFVNAYDTKNPKVTSDNLLLHLNFNEPQDLFSGSNATSSLLGYAEIENDSISRIKLDDIEAYNFPDLSTSQSYDPDDCPDCCDNLPEVFQYVSSSFPWQFKKFETRELVKIPDYGSNKFRSNKINFITQDIEKSLFYDSRTTKPSHKTSTKGADGLGVFFSPVDDLNTRIIEYFGDFDISDFIGDPKELYKNQYLAFERFKRHFYATGLTSIDFQTYINLVRSYFDNSLFKHLESLVPARSTFRTGILIEPSILERSKIESKPVTHERENDILGEHQAFKSSDGDMLHGTVMNSNNLTDSTGINTSASFSYPLNFNTFVNDVPEKYGVEVVADNGVVYKNGKKYYAEIITETKQLYRYDESFDSNDFIPITQSFEKLNLIPLGDSDLTSSLVSPNSRILNGYFKTHNKFKRRIFDSISVQTVNTTINPENGVLNGSEAVVLTEVDRGRINTGTQGEGNILDSDI
jgi:hypothetical protein